MGSHHGHRPCPALPSYSDLSHHSTHRQDDCNVRVYGITDHKKQFPVICDTPLRGENDTDYILWLGCKCTSVSVAWLNHLSHHRRVHSTNVLTALTYDRQWNLKCYLRTKQLRTRHIPHTPHHYYHHHHQIPTYPPVKLVNCQIEPAAHGKSRFFITVLQHRKAFCIISPSGFLSA